MPNVKEPTESAELSRRATVAGGMVRGIRCAVLASVISLSSLPALAEYRLGPGDALEISVLGVPELQRRTSVDPDGTISFPLLGTLTVAGQSLAEVRATVKAALASKVYRQKTPGGADRAIVIGIDEITVVVAEYRPIYVKGGVANAGEYTFRPSMTVREAVALSGGYDILPIKLSNPYLDAADFRGEYEALWVEFAEQQARVWRLETELEGGDLDAEKVAQEIPFDAPISRVLVAQIVALATEQFETRREDFERQESFLTQSIEQMDVRIEMMSRREKQEAKGAVADAEDLKRISALYNKRTLVHRSVIEARRNVLLSATRVLETTAELMQLKQQKTDLMQQLDRLDDERRIAGLEELEEATVRLGEIRTNLESVGKKLQYTAMAKAQVTEGDQKKPVITVHRKDESGWQPMVVNEAFELQPGDVVEISVGK